MADWRETCAKMQRSREPDRCYGDDVHVLHEDVQCICSTRGTVHTAEYW
jgi:hypothetical protein